jgi:phenylpyruvate tautomerase PptA (4-oxalocrotonate tautomerase family)
LIQVKLYDSRVTEESTPKIVQALTDALVSVTSEQIREQTWVIVEGVSPKNWGIAGKVSG